MLTHTDSECILNAAGTLGTIVCRFDSVQLFASEKLSPINCCENKNSTMIDVLFPLFQCGSKEGRELMVHHACVPEVIVNASILLSSPNDWIASNAALVLAR